MTELILPFIGFLIVISLPLFILWFMWQDEKEMKKKVG